MSAPLHLLLPLAQAATEPAGGAALAEVIGATTGASVLTAVLLVLGLGHRSGRVQALGRAARLAARVSGLPGWAALPSAISSVSLLTAVFGMYWDVALHIDVGRDAGPLANPAHYFILLGLFGIFSAGWVGMVLPRGRPGPTAVRIADDWHAPLGAVLVAACGAFSLLGFPLDDVWHRLFGQDVTLWGPTHLMLIGGAAMTLVGMSVLLVEGMRARRDRERAQATRTPSWLLVARRAGLTGGLLVGLSTFQAEFDFGVPQFRFVLEPMLIMLAAGAGLVATRVWGGRGAALLAVGFFLAVRGVLALLVGPVLGESTPHFPLYLAEALVVEAVALRVGRERPLAVGVWSGLGIGTVGLAAEWAWSHVAMPLPWPAELLPEAAALGLATALAASVLGAWVGARLASDEIARPPALRPAAAGAALAVAALIAVALPRPGVEGVSARVSLRDVRSAPSARTVSAAIALDPPSAADGAEWLTVTAWQGGGLVVDRLRRTGEGRYRTTRPIPVHGTWKALLRLHRGNELGVVGLYLPEDRAIPAREVPAPARFERRFVPDHEVLQRESRSGAPAVTAIAYGTVLAIALSLLALLAWGLHRLGATAAPAGPASADPRRAVAGAPRRSPAGSATHA